MIEIVEATSTQDLDHIRSLFREYIASLGVDLAFQGVEDELAGLPGKYAPPGGVLLLAKDGEQLLGCGALRPFGQPEKRICEMKRLYIRPAARGFGLGQRLAEELIERAVAMRYSTMLLDTLDRLVSAIRLYEILGFERVEPYYENPLPGVSYWMLDLFNWRYLRGQYAD